jgi:magnesium chelatase family protein
VVQRERFTGTRLLSNADMGPKQVRVRCKVDEAGDALIKAATRPLGLSARSLQRILRERFSLQVSRTIADLAGSEAIETTHLAEALQYRPRRQV